jgi:peptidoglycan/LPS O-acetylase OafA/YrhL
MGASTTGRPRLAQIPALDGLRGLAVIAVLLFHGGLAWATGGFLGVDVFFVLSGFLITSLLLGEQRATGTIGLGGFWARRARRLLPALVLVIAVVAVATPLFDPAAQVSLRGDALAALGYVANWRFVLAGADYFGRTAAESPLNHLWSLAIEEQFYLLWPLVLLAVARGRQAAVWVGTVAAVGAGASAATMVLLHRGAEDVNRVYYGTDTRVHTVLIGAALAALLAPRLGQSPTADDWPQPLRLLLGLVALVAAGNLICAVALVDGDQSWLYEGGLPLFSVAAALVIAQGVLVPNGLMGIALSLSPLRTVGRLSYGLYLWHWPIYLLLTASRTGLSGPALLVLRLVATFAVAFASDQLLERPFRAGWLRGWRFGTLAPAAGVGAAAIVLAGTIGVTGVGAPDIETALATTGAGPQPRASATPSTAVRPVAARVRAPGEPVKVLVLGDSVGLTIADGMRGETEKAGVAMTQAALLGCGVVRGGPLMYFGGEQPDPPACPEWPAHWLGALEAQNPDVALVVVGRWEVVDRFRDGRWAHLGEPDFDRYVESELERAVTTASSRGAKVVFATAPYYFRGERRDGGRWPEDNPERVDRVNALIRTVANRHTGIASVVELGAKTAKDGGYTRSLEGVQLRSDGVHFTRSGARWLAPWLLPQLTALGPPVRGEAPGPSTTAPRSGVTTTTRATTTRATTTSKATTTTRAAVRR